MGRPKKETTIVNETVTENNKPTPNDIEWTDYVLSLLSDDEKIAGNPTTDGLRRIFERVLDCVITESSSEVTQAPTRDNEHRATVVHTLTYVLNNYTNEASILNYRSVSGAADVYWGNCDKVYRNHPVAVAETRAEGRALRRGLKLRKVVAAEELAKEIEDHPDHDTINKITNNQINFIDVLAKRTNINVIKLSEKLAIDTKNIYHISYDDAVKIVSALTNYQQTNDIPESFIGYDNNWK
jgi:hypothetical protein